MVTSAHKNVYITVIVAGVISYFQLWANRCCDTWITPFSSGTLVANGAWGCRLWTSVSSSSGPTKQRWKYIYSSSALKLRVKYYTVLLLVYQPVFRLQFFILFLSSESLVCSDLLFIHFECDFFLITEGRSVSSCAQKILLVVTLNELFKKPLFSKLKNTLTQSRKQDSNDANLW